MAERNRVEVTLDGITFGDYEKLQGRDWKEAPLSEQLDLLDRFIVGNVRELPISSIDDIIAAIEETINSNARKN